MVRLNDEIFNQNHSFLDSSPTCTFAFEQFLVIGTLIKTGSISS